MSDIGKTVQPPAVSVAEKESLNKTIWSVAGGKGGTGKTILSANLGIGLAVLGYKVILIDADLGVPNLHNYLLITRPRTTLDDFIGKKKHLSDVIIDTPHENLTFVSGGTSLVGIANLHHTKKKRLIGHINKLDADIIIVDLGAGISNNTLDFFNMSTRGIVVINPEPNAKQDAYFFLKNALYRRIKMFMRVHGGSKSAFNAYVGANGNGWFEIPKFYKFLQAHSPEAYDGLARFAAEFRPRLILNKVRKSGQKKDGAWFINLVDTFLEVKMDYVGELKFDKRIIQTSEKIFPFIIRYPKAAITKNIFAILNVLNSGTMKRRTVPSWHQFRDLLRKEQKRWI